MKQICMEDNNLESYYKFLKDVEKTHSKIVDKSILEKDPYEVDINHIHFLPEGKIVSYFGEVRIEAFFHFEEDSPLLVILNGKHTLTNGKLKLPSFSRWSWYSELGMSMLNIEDPMLFKYKNEKLELGWFYGDYVEDYREYVAEYVRKIAAFLKVETKNIFFYGSSGGGTAAIALANKICGSIAIAINPQIYIQRHSYAKKFEMITGIDLSKEKQDRIDLVSGIKANNESKYFICVNAHSMEDMCEHLMPCMEELGMRGRYGLNWKKNVAVWIYDAVTEDPHTAFESSTLCRMILYIAGKMREGNGKENMDYMQIMSDIWHEYASQMKQIKKYKETNQGTQYVTQIEQASDFGVNMIKGNNQREIKLTEKVTNFNYYDLGIKLKSNSMYILTIEKSALLKGESQYWTFCFYDSVKKKRSLICKNEYNKRFQICFLTPENCNNLKMLIYSGEMGHTKGISISVSGLCLLRLGGEN